MACVEYSKNKKTNQGCVDCPPRTLNTPFVEGPSQDELDALGDFTLTPPKSSGYEKTDWGYIQKNIDDPGPDFYVLMISDKEGKLTPKDGVGEHYARLVELKNLIQEETVPYYLKDVEPDKWELLPESKSAFHMNGELGRYNLKFLNKKEVTTKDGTVYKPAQLEIVINTVTGKQDISIVNAGTTNFTMSQSGQSRLEKLWAETKHTFQDVLPYWDRGNSPHDFVIEEYDIFNKKVSLPNLGKTKRRFMGIDAEVDFSKLNGTDKSRFYNYLKDREIFEEITDDNLKSLQKNLDSWKKSQDTGAHLNQQRGYNGFAPY